MILKNCLILAFLLLVTVLAAADPPKTQIPVANTQTNQNPQKSVVNEKPTKVVITPNGNTDSVVLIINADNLNEILVVSDSGEWVSDAHELILNINIGSSVSVKCSIYKGLFKPSPDKITIKEWKVSKIMSASEKEFRGVIDGLHTQELFK